MRQEGEAQAHIQDQTECTTHPVDKIERCPATALVAVSKIPITRARTKMGEVRHAAGEVTHAKDQGTHDTTTEASLQDLLTCQESQSMPHQKDARPETIARIKAR
jgi:hypothetical protein